MLSEAVRQQIDEMIAISDELGAIVPRHGWTKYARSALRRLQDLSVSVFNSPEIRIDAKLSDIARFKGTPPTGLTDEERAQGFYVRDVDGNAVKFSSETYLPMEGQPKAFGANSLQEMVDNARSAIEARNEQAQARRAALSEHPRKGYMTCEEPVEFQNVGETTKDTKGRDVTHFNHDEETMTVTSEVRVEDGQGRRFTILPGPIEHLTIFASAEVGRGLDAAQGLSEQVGGSPESWKHSKGIGRVVTADGEEREADIHWFESRECGQLEWKIKQFVEDMDESQVYW